MSDNEKDALAVRILAAAAALIESGGAEAATTRAVAAKAGVQAPIIYRLFGDKQGLLDAAAEHVLATYVARKGMRTPTNDSVADLRSAWAVHLGFCLSNPEIFLLMIGTSRTSPSPAQAAGLNVLASLVRQVARTGRLRVSEERAVDLIHSVGTGTILTLLTSPATERGDLADAAWQAVEQAILDGAAPSDVASAAGAAAALRASLENVDVLTPGEKHLLDELLARIGKTGPLNRDGEG